MAKKSRRRKKSPATPEQLQARQFKQLQRQFGKQITTLFTRCGFTEVKSGDIELRYKEHVGEIDRIFVYGRIIVFVEETCSASSNIKPHLTKKIVFHGETKSAEAAFIGYLDGAIPGFKDARDPAAEPNDCKVSFVYAPRYNFEDADKSEFKTVKFLHFQYLRYFVHLTKVIGKSARFELLKFLGFAKEDTVATSGKSTKEYDGFVLPESPSGLPEGYRVVTFYIDAETLLGLSYALRRDSWLDSEPVYQRMLIASKIRKMRTFLADQGHVYINNIVVSLPPETELRTKDGKVLDKHQVNKAMGVKVRLPDEFNTIGLIDGQHRVFSYHEGTDSNEKKIAAKRQKQQLLVSGLIFPEGITVDERGRREADLFLEINENQSKAKAELKQAIATMVAPYSIVAIAKQIISELAKAGPLMSLLQDHAFGEGTIKTSSIVSYALRYIVVFDDPTPTDSFAARWDADKLAKLRRKKDKEVLREYIKFCASHLSQFISAFKSEVVPKELWTPNKKESRALSVTMLNGLIFCFRKILENDQLGDFKSYQKGFREGSAKLNLNFKPKSFGYKSSHWKSLGEKVYADCFDKSK